MKGIVKSKVVSCKNIVFLGLKQTPLIGEKPLIVCPPNSTTPIVARQVSSGLTLERKRAAPSGHLDGGGVILYVQG